MKRFKKFLAILLVASMIFTTNAVNVFAGGNKANQEEQLNEETTESSEETQVGDEVKEDLSESEEVSDNEEEATVGANVHGARPEDEENSTGAKLGEPEAEAEEDLKLNDKKIDELYGDPAKTLDYIDVSKYTITTYYVGDTYNTTDLEIKAYYTDESNATITYTGNEGKFTFEPDYVHNPFTESTPEEEPLEMRITYTESENNYAFVTTFISVRDNPAPPQPSDKNFYVLYYASDADYSTGTISEQHIPASASDDQLDYLTGDFFDSLRNLLPVLPWGFYKIGDGSVEFDIDDAKSAYDGTKTSADFIYNRGYLEEEGYKTWNNAGAANDIYYGVLYEVRPYMYWINGYDEEDVPTIYYYATEESGGTAVVIGTNGVEYNGLDSLVKQGIKKAVFVDDIVATDVRRYFAGFSGLESITGLGKLDTSNATSFEKMFDNCSTIEELDVSGLETDSLTDTSYMFNDCRNVTTITFGDNFDTSSVTNMKQMFSTCNALTTINFGNKFDTSNVTNMDSMFTAVGAETLDLAKFDTSKVTDMYGMFAESLELKTIKVSDKFVVDQVTESGYMFVDCSKLVGGKGTKYTDTENPWDKTYAHIDEGDANPGFFTAASTPKPTPTPTPTPNRGSTSSDSSSGGGGSSDPTHGPMGDLTKNPLYANALNNIAVNTTNNIPQSSLINNNGLYVQLKSMQENANASYCNARDYYGNAGYGQWLRVPNTTTWYFYSGDLSQATNGQPQGFLSNGWFNLGWDGIDRWYHFDGSGVMQLGWYQEAGKTYFLQNDFSDNWYGKAVTGTQNIGGRIYNFDANGALIN